MVAADKEKIFHTLNTRERDILDSKAWLNDIIIDGSMNLLKYQFPDLEDFQPAYLANLLDFEKQVRVAIGFLSQCSRKFVGHVRQNLCWSGRKIIITRQNVR